MPGYDLTVQAAAGLMSITGRPAGPPMKDRRRDHRCVERPVCGHCCASGLFARQRRARRRRLPREPRNRNPKSEIRNPKATPQLRRGLGRLHARGPSQCRAGRARRAASGRGDGATPIRRSFPTKHSRRPTAIWSWRSATMGSGNGFAPRPDAIPGPPIARFVTNPVRVEHRDELIPLLAGLMQTRSTAAMADALRSGRRSLFAGAGDRRSVEDSAGGRTGNGATSHRSRRPPLRHDRHANSLRRPAALFAATTAGRRRAQRRSAARLVALRRRANRRLAASRRDGMMAGGSLAFIRVDKLPRRAKPQAMGCRPLAVSRVVESAGRARGRVSSTRLSDPAGRASGRAWVVSAECPRCWRRRPACWARTES